MGKSALIIDDSPTAREVIHAALSELPFFEHVHVAPSGEDGLSLLSEKPVDCIVCDINMPGMSGFEFCREVRALEKTAGIPILLMTDKIDKEATHEDYMGCGADDYLSKPFHRAEIGVRIHNLLRLKAMQDELRIHEYELKRAKAAAGAADAAPAAEEQQINRELAENVQQLTKMISMQLSLGTSVDLDELLEMIIAKSKEMMEAEAASLLILDPATNELVFTVAQSEKGDEVKKHRLKPGQGIAGWVAKHGEPVVINDVKSNPRFFGGVDRDTKFETRNMMCVPLRYKGRITGVIQVINKTGERLFDKTELDIFQEFANQIAVAIENSSLVGQLKASNEKLMRRMAELSTLLEVQAALGSTIDLDNLLELIISKSKEVMRAEAASLMLLDKKTSELVFRVAQGEAGAALKEIRIPLGQGIAGWVAQTGEPVLVADAQNDPRLYRQADEKSKFITRNMICVPLTYKDEITGVVQAINKLGGGTFRESEIGLFTGFASQAAVAIENVNLFNQRLAEQKARLEMRHIFDSYVSPQVSKVLLENPEKLQLGGTREEVSVLFADIQGFTRLSEHMEPEMVVSFLNECLSEMVEVIFDHNGTLDKFMGDAIMALFGVPISYGDDPQRAVDAAIGMQCALEKLRWRWAEENKPLLYMGCSVHTGAAIVGNIGSAKKKDYTVIGDTVNVASRIEGLTRVYRCGIIISEETRNLLNDTSCVRELDVVKVKGREDHVKIYSVEPPELEGVLMLTPTPKDVSK